MKKLLFLISAVIVFFPKTAEANNRQPIFVIIGMDGQFLGHVNSDIYDDKGICNRYGEYGSKYSEVSFMNRYGDYGSQYSDFSAYNRNARKPPVIFKDGQPMGYLTKNRRIPGAVDPDFLVATACGKR